MRTKSNKRERESMGYMSKLLSCNNKSITSLRVDYTTATAPACSISLRTLAKIQISVCRLRFGKTPSSK